MTDFNVRLSHLRDIFLGDLDIQAALPRRPRVVPEAMFLPFGRTQLVAYGAHEPLVINTPRGRQAVEKLLSRLDGTLELEDLLAQPLEGEAAALFDLTVALKRTGFIEDGVPSSEDTPLTSFLARFVGATAYCSSRDEAYACLNKARIFCAVSGVSASDLRESLTGGGLSEIRVVDVATDPPDDLDLSWATHALFVINGADDRVKQSILRAHRQGVPHIVYRLGEGEAQATSMILPGATSGYDCISRTVELPPGEASPARARFWLHHAAHVLIAQAARLPSTRVNQVLHYRDLVGMPVEVTTISPVPGSETSQISSDDAYDEDESLRRVWRHHAGLWRSPKSMVSPLAHFVHFSAANTARTRKGAPPAYGSKRIPLPKVKLEGAPPWLAADVPDRSSAPLTLDSLSVLLQIIAGNVPGEDFLPRRFAPSGGGLQSPMLYLLIKDVPGLEDGGYRYFGADHVLEAMPYLDWELAADAALGAARRQCVIFNIGWFEKVRGKYGNFGYSVVHYDAGVTTSFCAVVCKVLSLTFREYALGDSRIITRALDLESDWRPYLATTVMTVGEELSLKPSMQMQPTYELIHCTRSSKQAGESDLILAARQETFPALQAMSVKTNLFTILSQRRSINKFGTAPLAGDLVRNLIFLAKSMNLERQSTGGLALNIWPLLLRARGTPDLPAGVYSAEYSGDKLERRRDYLSSDELAECINQQGLATAGDIIVMVGDLRSAVRTYGEVGYRALLMRAGSMVADMWLAAQAAGVKSTAAGGVLEPGMRYYAGCDGYRECPLLSFVVGSALDGPDSSAPRVF